MLVLQRAHWMMSRSRSHYDRRRKYMSKIRFRLRSSQMVDSPVQYSSVLTTKGTFQPRVPIGITGEPSMIARRFPVVHVAKCLRTR